MYKARWFAFVLPAFILLGAFFSFAPAACIRANDAEGTYQAPFSDPQQNSNTAGTCDAKVRYNLADFTIEASNSLAFSNLQEYREEGQDPIQLFYVHCFGPGKRPNEIVGIEIVSYPTKIEAGAVLDLNSEIGDALLAVVSFKIDSNGYLIEDTFKVTAISETGELLLEDASLTLGEINSGEYVASLTAPPAAAQPLVHLRLIQALHASLTHLQFIF
jgi:hypothetical protein